MGGVKRREQVQREQEEKEREKKHNLGNEKKAEVQVGFKRCHGWEQWGSADTDESVCDSVDREEQTKVDEEKKLKLAVEKVWLWTLTTGQKWGECDF